MASIDIGGGATDMAIVHYQLNDGVRGQCKNYASAPVSRRFKVARDDLLWISFALRRSASPAKTALQRAGVTDAAALLATLFGDSGQLILQYLRQQTALQLFILTLGHAVLSAQASDINDPLPVYATFGDR